jgi:uncharacterized Zn finger protein (UPF0148 family)
MSIDDSASTHRTLDLEHASAVRRMTRDKSRAEDVRAKIRLLTEKIGGMERGRSSEMTDCDFEDLKRMRWETETLRRELADAEQRADGVGYYIRTADVLFRYYDILEKGTSHAMARPVVQALPFVVDKPVVLPDLLLQDSTISSTVEPVLNTEDRNVTRSILSYFRNDDYYPDHGGHGEHGGHGDSTRRQHDLRESRITTRASLFDRYMERMDPDAPPTDTLHVQPNVVKSTQLQTHTHGYGHGPCGHCGHAARSVQLQDGYVFCPSCQTVEYILIDHEKPAQKELNASGSGFYAYKRLNHFNEWLAQVQGKETTEIPEDVYDSILFEMKKQKITNAAKLTKKKVREILKKLRIHRYYEHSAHIINRINGIPSPQFSAELEEKLRYMFCQIQVPFLKHAPSNRKNFLSYSFCLNKMMQLLEKDQYLDSFNLLKSREKLGVQDSIWKKICGELGWDYIPSM